MILLEDWSRILFGEAVFSAACPPNPVRLTPARRLAAPVCLCNTCDAVPLLEMHVASMRAARVSFTFRLESFSPSSEFDVPLVQWG